MIRGYHLFGRNACSPREKKMVQVANETALRLFKRRNDENIKDRWDVPVNDLTMQDVEDAVVEAILTKYPRKRCQDNISKKAHQVTQKVDQRI